MSQGAGPLLINEVGVDPEVKQLPIANIARPENRIKTLENLEREVLFRLNYSNVQKFY